MQSTPRRTIRGRSIDAESLNWEQAKAWLAANGIDPAKVPADSTFEIHAETIRFEEITIDGRDVRRVDREVPLHSAPEDHGL